MARRIRTIPGERKAQYFLNFDFETGPQATTRVSVRKMDVVAVTGSARSVQAIFTYSGSSNDANCSGANAPNFVFATHGWVTAPITISRPGTSASTPHPSALVLATK